MFSPLSKGKVKIINSRETVPGNFKPDLLDSCPKTFQMVSGTVYQTIRDLRGFSFPELFVSLSCFSCLGVWLLHYHDAEININVSGRLVPGELYSPQS